ncbi:hypothetical protein CNEO3_130073 [Clostridium neonatale]|uniref:Uncharacterized protein n=1 Tax=Clostridium neonatale TaxID=137838 RepID=A0AA86JKG1_9CLOT|nr:hypothetical protein CNEO_44464 [Clostridium neonatale]CAI3540442.1 hypothetical protein CNEO3_140008 [Clostridium neonatale]CAI3553978.1 hypothetical protein CNEO3_1040008 [Clostridium neonatale]CAI3582274.1 hypothetical protein CNEO3_130073 [Clostridium neonatale]CAI3583877.1 hypothetical protein CNEO3_170073 [Clostridium neonatale]
MNIKLSATNYGSNMVKLKNILSVFILIQAKIIFIWVVYVIYEYSLY